MLAWSNSRLRTRLLSERHPLSPRRRESKHRIITSSNPDCEADILADFAAAIASLKCS
jgi:hypothetical protein